MNSFSKQQIQEIIKGTEYNLISMEKKLITYTDYIRFIHYVNASISDNKNNIEEHKNLIIILKYGILFSQFMFEATIILKNLLLIESEIEKVYFKNKSILMTYEFIKTTYDFNRDMYQLMQNMYPEHLEFYKEQIVQLKKFKKKYNYNKLKDIRNEISGHYSRDVLNIREHYNFLKNNEQVFDMIEDLNGFGSNILFMLLKLSKNWLVELKASYKHLLPEFNKKYPDSIFEL